jgi:hypothetical protein
MTALFNYTDFYIYLAFQDVLLSRLPTTEGQSRRQNILKVQDTNGIEEDINKPWKW